MQPSLDRWRLDVVRDERDLRAVAFARADHVRGGPGTIPCGWQTAEGQAPLGRSRVWCNVYLT